MLALYRSGRQAEGLHVYRETRRMLVDQLGIDPSPALQELERSILRQDATLEAAAPERSILVAVRDPSRLDALIPLAEPLERELILCAVVSEPAALARTTALLNEWRRPGVRAAAFTSADPDRDLLRFVSDQDVDLLLLDRVADAVLREAPCDVGVLLGGGALRPGPLLVPFGGAEHDWAAVELAAWLAGAHGAALRLAGTSNSSRVLATASLVVQRAVGIATEPVLVSPGADGIVAAAENAGLVVIGLSDRWRQEGVGETRLEIARRAPPPTMLVRKGLRPGGLAPRESLTRFTWSLSAAGR
jgi:nucleotide-binding universal stress UspA family protein